ncbi:MAG: DUF262 domain-containing protein [Rikenellaceae bacterium]
MSKLNVDQKSIKDLLQNNKADFLIPDYQRPYAWGEKECQTLWDDIFTFAFPDNDSTKFDSTRDEYFLGPIVSFKNSDDKMEIIDGQQRLTTIMLLLRAFYSMYGNMKDDQSVRTKEIIEKCIWKTDEFGQPNMSALKIDSQVATDNDKDDFLNILKSATTLKGRKSNYAANFKFFQEKIDLFLKEYPSYFSYFPIRILNNCILLPIEAESQDTALRIFSTLNDRGKPLSDSDIFKAQFYKYYTKIGKKEQFIKLWRELEEKTEKIFQPIYGTPMNELFTRYMYFERAKQDIKSSTTEALRKFYEKDNYRLLNSEETLNNLALLVDFWIDVSNQNSDRFSDRVLKRLFVLNYAPNSMWAYILSVYFMVNKSEIGMLDDDNLYLFLNKITAFIWTYAVTNPGVNALRTPIFAEMINIVNNRCVSFDGFHFDSMKVKSMFNNFSFLNGRPITKSMIAWWAFNNNEQPLLSLDSTYELEHIYPRSRQDKEGSLRNTKNIDLLGNKALLEKRINIRASDYRFCDKVKYYNGYINSKAIKVDGTKNQELANFAVTYSDFVETHIIDRNNAIIDTFVDYLKSNLLLQ